MIETNVLILIEHVARELESAVLLKVLLQKKGYSVIIDSLKFNKEKIILKYSADIIIVPWAYTNKEMSLFQSLIKVNNQAIIINMHHEQISNEGSDEFILPQDDARNMIHLSWGENFTKKLIAVGCKEKNIIQCGNIRLDFYKKKLKLISKSKNELNRKYNLDAKKRKVLFIANSFHLLTEEQININLAKGVDIKDQISSSKKNRKDFLEFAEKYLECFDDTEFIYRPHPSFAHIDSEEEQIKNLSEKYESFKCISKESIRDWILNCDIAISFHSTSVIECSVTDCKFYLFRSEKLEESKDYKFFVNYEKVIKNYEDFISAISGEEFNYNKFRNDIKADIDLNINHYSSEIFAENIDYIMKNKAQFKNTIKYSYKNHLKNIVIAKTKYIMSSIFRVEFIKKIVKKKNDIRLFNLLYEGDDYFTAEDVIKIENKIRVSKDSFYE